MYIVCLSVCLFGWLVGCFLRSVQAHRPRPLLSAVLQYRLCERLRSVRSTRGEDDAARRRGAANEGDEHSPSRR